MAIGKTAGIKPVQQAGNRQRFLILNEFLHRQY
jgi:hypothetical protein